jgi:hypothetical protein
MYDDYEEESYDGDKFCPFCSGKGWYNSDGWPIHCGHCESSCDERCPACMISEDADQGEEVTSQ